MRQISSVFSEMSSFSKAVLASAVLGLFVMASATSVQAQETTSTTARETVTDTQPQAEERPPLFITFTPIHRGTGPTPDATFGCSIPYPSATETFNTRTATWTGSISCSVAVGLYGTTAFFNYNTNVVLGYGTQINTTATSASSSGSHSNVPTGTYEVNFNVDITPPAGYTTSVGGGCSYINGGPRVHCTVGSGTFNQP